jgi:hypothetical protein
MKLFEITIAGRRFTVAREPGERDQFYQTYTVDGRDVPVHLYLKMIAMAVTEERRSGVAMPDPDPRAGVWAPERH